MKPSTFYFGISFSVMLLGLFFYSLCKHEGVVTLALYISCFFFGMGIAYNNNDKE